MSLSCAHCELPVPPAFVRSNDEHQFCCAGCRTAFDLIHGCGLADYYAIAERAAVERPELDYGGFDDAAFVERYTELVGDGERRITLAVDGIHCAACIWLLEKLPRVAPGVTHAAANWHRRTLTVRWDPDRVALSEVASSVAGLGYSPHVLEPGTRLRDRIATNRRVLVELGVAAAAAGNNMLIAASLYLGMFGYMSSTSEAALRWASCAVGMVSLLWPGRVFFAGAFQALRARTPHMDLPVALGLSVGGIAGLVHTVSGRGEVYFDTLSVLVFLLLLGRFIQSRQQQRAAAAVEVMHRLTPRSAHRFEHGDLLEVPAEVLNAGDRLRVLAGETIPADATVLAGHSSIDASILTGETQPVDVAAGDLVTAGALNVSAALELRVDAVREQTRIGKILELVESSARDRPQIVQLADRIGAHFVVTVLALAALTFGVWIVLEPTAAVDRTVALLIVACPCALALATPLALSVALGKAASRRILIKGGDVLQRLATPGTIWLDKTGTLTEGRATVVEWVGDASVRVAVAALERDSTHPVGVALASVGTAPASSGAQPASAASGVCHTPGGGVRGRVAGSVYAVGTEAFVGAPVPANLRREAHRIIGNGRSPVFVSRNGVVVAIAGVGDAIREGAAEAIVELRRRGWAVGILSGDHPQIVASVGEQLGLPAEVCRGGLGPEDKVECIRATSRGPVVMVGDGVNDSAALAAAAVGIATRNGAEASLEAAAVYLGRPGIRPVVDLLDGSRSTMRTIRRNFEASLLYNALAVGLAALGWVSPLVAAVLMPLSSLTVVSLSLALRWPEAKSA